MAWLFCYVMQVHQTTVGRVGALLCFCVHMCRCGNVNVCCFEKLTPFPYMPLHPHDLMIPWCRGCVWVGTQFRGGVGMFARMCMWVSLFLVRMQWSMSL